MRFLIMRDAHEKYTATLLKLLTFCYTFSLDHQISKIATLKVVLRKTLTSATH